MRVDTIHVPVTLHITVETPEPATDPYRWRCNICGFESNRAVLTHPGANGQPHTVERNTFGWQEKHR